jgi:hypothetical protein
MLKATLEDLAVIEAMLAKLHAQTPEEAAAEGRAQIDAIIARVLPSAAGKEEETDK